MTTKRIEPITSRWILFYDGACGLCSGLVRLLLKLDRRSCIFFASLTSDLAKEYLIDCQNLDTVVLVHDEKIWTKSAAILQLFRLLGGVWRMGLVFGLFPSYLLDKAYDVVARNRFLLLKPRSSCRMPEPKHKERFLH